MRPPNVCVLNAPGINCNPETGTMFQRAQADLFPLEDTAVEQVHITELEAGDRNLSEFQILALPGGFSYGDDIAAGRILGVKLRTHLADEVNSFMSRGGLVLAICNGDQIVIESGLIPDGTVRPKREAKAALLPNLNGQFDCRWGRLAVNDSVCKFVSKDELGEVVELPWAHGEGRAAFSTSALKRVLGNNQVVFQYVDLANAKTTEYPYNPSGSPLGIAGVCDPTGQALGMMPHPERFIRQLQHPDARRRDVGPPVGLTIAKRMLQVAA